MKQTKTWLTAAILALMACKDEEPTVYPDEHLTLSGDSCHIEFKMHGNDWYVDNTPTQHSDAMQLTDSHMRLNGLRVELQNDRLVVDAKDNLQSELNCFVRLTNGYDRQDVFIHQPLTQNLKLEHLAFTMEAGDYERADEDDKHEELSWNVLNMGKTARPFTFYPHSAQDELMILYYEFKGFESYQLRDLGLLGQSVNMPCIMTDGQVTSYISVPLGAGMATCRTITDETELSIPPMSILNVVYTVRRHTRQLTFCGTIRNQSNGHAYPLTGKLRQNFPATFEVTEVNEQQPSGEVNEEVE